MTTDPLALLPEVDRAESRLRETAGTLSDTDLTGPSLLPGWTRGHVLTHLARNADGLVNLLTWARTGVVTPQYVSQQRRDADIEAGSGRPAAEQQADLRDAAARFATIAAEMPASAWAATLELPTGPQVAAMVVWRRLREVEVHHVDLAAGYPPARWPDLVSHRLLHEIVTGLRDAPALVLRADGLGHDLTLGPDGGPVVAGPAHDLAAWLAGRSTGDGLRVDPPGPLPSIPAWI